MTTIESSITVWYVENTAPFYSLSLINFIVLITVFLQVEIIKKTRHIKVIARKGNHEMPFVIVFGNAVYCYYFYYILACWSGRNPWKSKVSFVNVIHFLTINYQTRKRNFSSFQHWNTSNSYLSNIDRSQYGSCVLNYLLKLKSTKFSEVSVNDYPLDWTLLIFCQVDKKVLVLKICLIND